MLKKSNGVYRSAVYQNAVISISGDVDVSLGALNIFFIVALNLSRFKDLKI